MPDRIREFADSTDLSNMSPNGAVELAYISDVEGLGIKDSDGNWKIAPSFFGSGLHFLETYKPDLWLSADRSRCGVTGARDFNGTDQYFALASAIEPGADDWWMAAWVYPNALPGAGNEVMVLGSVSNTDEDGVFVDENGYVSVRIGGSVGTVLDETAIPAGIWTHIVVTREGSTGNLALYINGASVSLSHDTYTGVYSETGRLALLSAGWTISDGGAV